MATKRTFWPWLVTSGHYILRDTMNKPDISVIMSVYKESAVDIQTAVSSILKQTFTNWELILVNDNPESTEVRKILENIQAEDTRITVITNDRNRGLGYALNAAVKQARAGILARMDAEDISKPKRFELQLAYLREHPDVDLLFTQWYEQDSIGDCSLRAVRREDVCNLKKNFFIKSLLLHPTLMVRKQVLVDHPYPPIGRPEDLPLFMKLIRLGYTFDLLEQPLYTYMIERDDVELRYKKIKAYTENYLPKLIGDIRWYWTNPYFWIYFFRVCAEFIVSRNKHLFSFTHTTAGALWRRIFRSA